MIEIDGSKKEGGGSLLRMSIAFSAITGKPVEVYNIRGKRSNPGLRPQHLKAIKAVGAISNANVEGDEIGSERIKFEPNELSGGNLKVDIGTAGSITLLLQSVLPVGLSCPSKLKVEIIGGTDVKWSPSTSYFQKVFLRFLDKIGAMIDFQTVKHGFYPKGGGKVKVEIEPSEIEPFEFTGKGKLKKVLVESVTSKKLEGSNVAERTLNSFVDTLASSSDSLYEEIVERKINYCESESPGTSVNAYANYENSVIGSVSYGEKGKPSEKVGKECARKLLNQMNEGAVDKWLTDQLIPYLALAGKGKLKTNEVTMHTKTNIWVAEHFLPVKFEIEGDVIRCEKS